MDSTCDVFLTQLPKTITEVVVKNLFSSAGKVLKVKIIDDKRNENFKLCFVGFATMDEALEAVRISDNSLAFGEPIRASISKKCLEGMENAQNRTTGNRSSGNIRPSNNLVESPENRFSNIGRGRGIQAKFTSSPPSFKLNDVKLNEINLKLKELLEVEVIELFSTEYVFVRPIKATENSKIEIADLLSKINATQSNLVPVETPKIDCCYLAKWDDECYYRAEILEIMSDNKFKVTFVDEGTSGDIVKEIRHIPTGPLQQYPKQFSKLVFGCQDMAELRDFIVQESEGKIVKIYWLGERYMDSVPLVNLFLNEDEIIEKYSHINKINVRQKFSLRFDDLPVHKAELNTNFVFVPSLFKRLDDFVLQVKDTTGSVQLSKRKCPPLLPTPGDICIYDKRSSNGSQLLRSMIIRRQLFSFDIQLIDTGEKISNVNIDNIYMAEDSHKIDSPMAINCELSAKGAGHDQEGLVKQLSNEGVKFTIVQYKANNKYIVNFDCSTKNQYYEYSELCFGDYTGKSFKSSVSHFVSPMEFYIQLDQENVFQVLADIQEKINVNYNATRFRNVDEVQINQAVVAPYIVEGTDAEYFRARVIEKRRYSPQIHVFFIDYGNDEWVTVDSLMNVDDDLARRPGMALQCQLNVEIKKEAYAHAIETFGQLVGGNSDDLNVFTVQIMCVNERKFIVDLLSQLKGSLTAILEKTGTCTRRIDEKSLSKSICNGGGKTILMDGEDEEIATKQNGYSPINQNRKSDNVHKNDYKKLSKDELWKKIAELEERIVALERVSKMK